MFVLKVEQSFDSAHFLANYKGKCSNIHGHRWKVEIEVKSEELISGGQLDGMVVDFGELKEELKKVVDEYDHKLIIQQGSMRQETLSCLKEDGFNIIETQFRPTAENFAKYFFGIIKNKGHNVSRAMVYETPTNCACYQEGDKL